MHKNLWHPYINDKGAAEPVKVNSARGAYLNLNDGRKVIDCISGRWGNIHGYARQEISEAIYEQSQQPDHIIYPDITHDLAGQLAERLTGLLPRSLNRVLYSASGSAAVQAGMKMASRFWENKGEQRKSFIGFEGAFHGETFGVQDQDEQTKTTDVYKNLHFDVELLSYPETWQGDKDRAAKEDAVIERLETLLDDNPDKYAGILMEPLVQGAGGMRMCSEEFMQKLHWVNRQFGVLLIFDEAMTGFGRTGDYFACKRAQVEPDIICLSDGITGGFMPLALTVCSDEIFETVNSAGSAKSFRHGDSQMVSPRACAAALASLDILEQEAFKKMEAIHREEMKKLSNHPKLEKFRVKGTVAAMEIKINGESGDPETVAATIEKNCPDHCVLLKPMGNVLYLMPPYCITEEDLRSVYQVIPDLIG